MNIPCETSQPLLAKTEQCQPLLTPVMTPTIRVTGIPPGTAEQKVKLSLASARYSAGLIRQLDYNSITGHALVSYESKEGMGSMVLLL